MNRKLLILDVALAAGAIYGGIQLHSQWAAAKARETAAGGYVMKPAPPPVVPPLPQEQVVLPSGYKTIAVNTLFDPSRNPNIPIDIPPPPPPPPVPPALPSFHGMMDFGDGQGPIAIMSLAGTPGQEEVHAGGKIGPFKLLAFSRREITLEWEGQVIHKAVDQASDANRAAPQQKADTGPIGTTNGMIPGIVSPPQQFTQQTTALGPGQDLTDTNKACQAGDSNAAGAVVNGYRKDIKMTPFGSSQCVWTAVGK